MKKKLIGLIFILILLWFMVIGYGYVVKRVKNYNVSKLPKQESNIFGRNQKAELSPSYPIDTVVSTSLEKSIVPISVVGSGNKLATYDIENFEKNGYGLWKYGSGESLINRIDIMGSGYNINGISNTSSLIRFFTLADTHITDEESPAQGIFIGLKPYKILGGYSPVMLYTTQVLDAAVQTINALNKKEKFDFGIVLGDLTNSTQYNELRWFIDVLDGKTINPDSGKKDDPILGPNNDYQDEFKAAGLDKSIPWYATIGNHDRFWMGAYIIKDRFKKAFISKNILTIGNIFQPGGFESGNNYVGTIDGTTPYGKIIGTGFVNSIQNQITVIPDKNRNSLSKSKWMNEFLNTESLPIGHGFTQLAVISGFSCYTFEPKLGLPIKVIVLDDTQSDDLSKSYGHGSLDKIRYEWLIKELDKGQSEGKLMIIAAHAPIGVEPPESVLSWYQNSYVSQEDLLEKLHSYPNLLMWIAGHRHENTITPFKSPDPLHPEFGFWLVETYSLRDFPQMFRTFDIVRNSDNSISIFATDVYPSVGSGSLAELSRNYGLAIHQILNHYKPIKPYNAQLFKKLTPEMQVKVQSLGTQVNK